MDQQRKQIYFGRHGEQLLKWLSHDWVNIGPSVCIVEGFSGVGKKNVALRLLSQLEETNYIPILVDTLDSESTLIDDLLLNLAEELELKGVSKLVDAIDQGKDLLHAFQQVLMQPVVIVIDNFQRALNTSSGRPTKLLENLLKRISNREQSGRLLLLSNRSVERARWSESIEKRILYALEQDEAEELLAQLLKKGKREKEIPSERRADIVAALGRNPRAIHTLVESLRWTSIEELIGENPNLWEIRDRDVSSELLRELEKTLLLNTLKHLSEPALRTLNALTVYRKSISSGPFKHMFADQDQGPQMRTELINMFLIDHNVGWYTLHPLVREITLDRLRAQPDKLRGLHSLAANHYASKFKGHSLEGKAKLGGSYVEARYHLVRAKREEELGKIARNFEHYVRQSFSDTSKVPKDPNELNERIALLSGLLKHQGAKGLEYHLARCYVKRSKQGDRRKALLHLRSATGIYAELLSLALNVE
ncbi:MAG: AAA family ATPase [Bacteroidota bacterium]